MTRHLEPKRGGKTSRVNTFAAAALAFAETKPLNIKKNWRSAPCRTPCRQTAVNVWHAFCSCSPVPASRHKTPYRSGTDTGRGTRDR